jgi:hypothetical protein
MRRNPTDTQLLDGNWIVDMTNKLWTNNFFDEVRQQGDPLADNTVLYLFQKGGIQAVNDAWDVLLQNDQIPPKGLPAPIYEYLNASGILPAWADADLIVKGEEFFMENGVFCLASLLCASLPECYVMAKGAHVLGSTQNLDGRHTVRRLFETAQMLVAVMAPHGLAPEGGGIRAIQKVRLMHAAIRHLLLESPPPNSGPPKHLHDVLLQMPWDVKEQGYPINQEDMAYTLLTFSFVILRALKKMGIAISEHEAAAYMHVWKVAGYFMGVDDRMLVDTVAEGEELFNKIKARQAGASKDGKKLTRSLDAAVSQIFSDSSHGLVSKWMLKPVPHVIMRQFLDAPTVAMLGIRRATVREWIALKLLRLFELAVVTFYNFAMRTLGGKFGTLLVDYLTRLPRGWKRQLFDLPEQIRTRWKLPRKHQHKPHR